MMKSEQGKTEERLLKLANKMEHPETDIRKQARELLAGHLPSFAGGVGAEKQRLADCVDEGASSAEYRGPILEEIMSFPAPSTE